MNESDLWAAVVMQALEDIEHEPLDSPEYADAERWFTAGHEWARSRADICDALGLDLDRVVTQGREIIARRRAEAGLPPVDAVARSAPVRRISKREMAHQAVPVAPRPEPEIARRVRATLQPYEAPPPRVRGRRPHFYGQGARIATFFPRGYSSGGLS